MTARRLLAAALLITGLHTGTAVAQDVRGRYEAGLLVGWTKTGAEASALAFDVSSTYQATFAWRVHQGATASWSIEVPLFAAPALGVKTVGASLPKEYAALFLTPGVRVTLHPERTVSVFGAVGGGYARYSESKLKVDNSPNPLQRDTNAWALQFCGGVDVRSSRWLALRGEVRDVYTGARNFSVVTPGERVHNVIASAGIVLSF